MLIPAVRSRLGVPALALVATAALAADAVAQQRWSHASVVQYQIRQYPPSGVCPPGFGPQSFNHAGWGVRAYCIMCPAGYLFVATAGTYACASCPPGTTMGSRAGYAICNQ